MMWSESTWRPGQLTLATIVFIPELSGYWAESLRVLELSLRSLHNSTDAGSFDLVVLDNGSCAEVISWLERSLAAGDIDTLIRTSENLGKVGAWNILMGAAPGDVIGYFDSDVLFLPGWLESGLAVLECFPESAMVTCQPIAGDLSQHCDATLRGAAADVATELEEGSDLIPPEYVASQQVALGLTRDEAARRVAGRRDVRLRRSCGEAYVSASHFQFLTRKEIASQVLPLPPSGALRGDEVFDERLDSLGFWRLSTTDYLVHHLGNRLPDLDAELPWLADETLDALRASMAAPYPRPPRRRRVNSPRLRRLLKRLHAKTFQLLYGE